MVRRIILIGFMASGMSAVAAELARRTGWRFVDFDREIEDRLGLPVGEIVALSPRLPWEEDYRAFLSGAATHVAC
jgi:shikimate kinase